MIPEDLVFVKLILLGLGVSVQEPDSRTGGAMITKKLRAVNRTWMQTTLIESISSPMT